MAAVVVVVLPNPFRGIWAWRNFTKTQQLGHAPWSEPEVKNGRSSAKDSAPEKLGDTLNSSSQVPKRPKPYTVFNSVVFYLI